MKRFINLKAIAGLALLLLLAMPIVAVSDSATVPMTLKYGVLVLGSSDPNGDGSTTDATTGSLKMRNTGGTLVEFTAAEIEGLAAATDKAIPYGDGSIWAKDATNFSWDDGTNAKIFQIGSGTAPGNMRFLEGSGGGTNYVDVKAPAALSSNPVFTWPTVTFTGLTALPASTLPLLSDSSGALSTGALTVAQGGTGLIAGQLQRLIYSALSASAAHTGATDAETVVMPATADNPLTVTTSIGNAQLAAGNVLPWTCTVAATSDGDSAETLTVNVYFGAQLVGTSGAVALSGPATIVMSGAVKIRVTGASGTGYCTYTSAESVNLMRPGAAAFSSFDTTAAQAFSVKLDWNETGIDAADTATVEDLSLYVASAD